MWAVVCWEERCMTTRKNGCEGDFCLNSCTFRSLSSFKELPLLVRRSRRISKDSSSRRIINNYWMRFLRLITLTETLMILDVTKTESNNCFIIHCLKKKYRHTHIAPRTVSLFSTSQLFLLRCPWTWHCPWKSCIAHVTYRLFTNLLAD